MVTTHSLPTLVRHGDAALEAIGPLGRLLRPTLRNTYSITKIAAGMQHNVVPFAAAASIDGRCVPGYEAELLDEIRQLVGDLADVEVVQEGPAVQARFDGTVPDAIRAAIDKEDPGAAVVPTCLPIGTDAKHFDRLAIRHFGFVPLLLPAGYDFASMFHGVDERVPVSALAGPGGAIGMLPLSAGGLAMARLGAWLGQRCRGNVQLVRMEAMWVCHP